MIAALAMVAVLASATDVVAPSSGQPAIGLDDRVGATIPAATIFHDSTGAPVSLAQYLGHGKPVLLVLAYARCTMLCSVVLHAAGDAIAAGPLVPGRDFTPVVVSLDPRETTDEAARRQAVLVERIGRAGDRGAWPYLTGDDAAIHELAAAVGFRYAWDARTEQYAHPAAIFVVTPDGRLAQTMRGVAFPDLDAALERARRGLLTADTSDDLVACFHFDPSLRRHQAMIQTLFRTGASAVLVALIAMIAGLVLLERRRARRARKAAQPEATQP